MRDIPEQMNGYDCGVFTLAFADYCSRDAPFDFSQVDMEFFRAKLVAEIISLKVD